MSLVQSSLVTLSLVFFALMFAVAWWAQRAPWLQRLGERSTTYTLALGVYVSAWAFYGTVGIAHQYDFVFLAYYSGICGAFLLAPMLLAPVLRLTRAHQLRSLADLFLFRFRGKAVGTVTTLLMLVAVLPLLAMQVQAVVDSFVLIVGKLGAGLPVFVAGVLCLAVAACAVLANPRVQPGQHKRSGLVLAVALGSLIKLVALLVLGGLILVTVFHGPERLQAWLDLHRASLGSARVSLDAGPWRTMLLTFFASAVVMPDMFHMTFAANRGAGQLRKASWLLPLYLLLISLPVPLIVWGAMALGTDTVPEYYALGIAIDLGRPWLVLLVYVGGLCAASASLVVAVVALSSMVVTHCVLPVRNPAGRCDIYGWIGKARRLFICVLTGGVFGLYLVLDASGSIIPWVLLSFMAVVQFFPGVLAVVYWPGARRAGLVAGQVAGFLVWVVVAASLLEWSPFAGSWLDKGLHGSGWYLWALLPLLVNSAIFIAVSALMRQSPEEVVAGRECFQTLDHQTRRPLQLSSVGAFRARLAAALGQSVAQGEVDRAMESLGLEEDDQRPYALRRLRDRIESNLSALLGPGLARDTVTECLPYSDERSQGQDFQYIESQVEVSRHDLTGLAADLDQLRLYHRHMLNSLPVALCALGKDQEVLVWNRAMETLTALPAATIVGSRLETLAAPWSDLLMEGITDSAVSGQRCPVTIDGQSRIVHRHTNEVEGEGCLVMTLEDQTDIHLLEQTLMHNERLAAIGQLAAGVAHEIGNPLTGVDCLAQELRSGALDEEDRQLAEQILEQTRRMAGIVRSLVSFAHKGGNPQDGGDSGKTVMDVFQCARDAIGLLELNRDGESVRFVNRCQAGCKVSGHSQKITQVLVNLLDNARDASPAGSDVVIEAQPVSGQVRITVTDAGCGIPASDHRRVFEPFYTTKPVGQGTGLGMALAYNIIEEHHGSISIESPVTPTGVGTRICIALPCAREAGAGEAAIGHGLDSFPPIQGVRA